MTVEVLGKVSQTRKTNHASRMEYETLSNMKSVAFELSECLDVEIYVRVFFQFL